MKRTMLAGSYYRGEDQGTVKEVKLIKYAEVLQTWTPQEKNWRASFNDNTFDGRPTYYRMEVLSEGPARRAVTFAIFVQLAATQLAE